MDPLTLGAILAPVISAIGAAILYHYLGKEYLGANELPYWNAFRRWLLSASDSTVRKKTGFVLTNPALEKDYALTATFSTEEVADLFADNGATVSVLSGLKYRPPNVDPNTSTQVEFEDGSMVFRESKSDLVPDALALRQVHVYWFDNGDGTLDLYAHEEYSSMNPLVAWKHYRAVTMNAEKGIEYVSKLFDDE